MSAQATSPTTDPHSWRNQLPYSNPDFTSPLYHSRCHCGRVQFSVNRLPLDAKLCHCRDCRVLHGAPMQHAAIFPKKNVKFDPRSLDHIVFYAHGERSSPESVPGLPRKVSCGWCGSRLADGAPSWMGVNRRGEEYVYWVSAVF
jgi:hypothetical protein